MGKVCVIGAGSSGIGAVKVLQDYGIDFDCLERSDCVGGNWVYDNVEGRSSVYGSAFTNTSKQMLQYSDFPMSDDYPTFPHHSQISQYLNDYVDHFGLRERIEFDTEVHCAEPFHGNWKVTLVDGSIRHYSAVLAATGHHWDENWPDFPGRFDGEEIHAHQYRSPGEFSDKIVLVVGMGDSAVDIASEVSHVSEMTYVSTRNGAHVIPKLIGHVPVDQFIRRSLSYMPLFLHRLILSRAVRRQQGKITDLGLPKPDHKLLDINPTISSSFLQRIKHGSIKIKPDVKELQGDEVAFEDGSRLEVDRIIYATGYKTSFPYLPKDVFNSSGRQIRLYRHVVHPHEAGLYFIGLAQPQGARMPLAEVQSVWVARLLCGEVGLPDQEKMELEIDGDLVKMYARFSKSGRYMIQVAFNTYLRQLKREMKHGRRYPKRTESRRSLKPVSPRHVRTSA